jgi:tetratricopeptide (TPR) repeat protein
MMANVQQKTRVKPVIPIVHEVAWVALVTQGFFILILIGITAFLGFDRPILIGTLSYLIIAFFARLIFTRHHRQGMYLAQEGMFDEAIGEFQSSYEFFTRNVWLDDWRYVVLLSSSKTTYREMALLDIAYCDLWSDRAEDAIRIYLRLVEEFPENGMAWSAIKTFQQGGHDGERRARAAMAASPSVGQGMQPQRASTAAQMAAAADA